jgi:NIMA-interacting peptidyl-prolyl cis-trans isomerase 1
MSKSRNMPYYFNTTTIESRWVPPDGADLEKHKVYMASYQSRVIPNSREKIRVAHLLVKHRESRRPSSWRELTITRSKDEAKEILLAYEQRIRTGETTLGELAKTESDDSSAKKNGDLGFFGRGDMQKEFEDAAFALKLGEVSHIVETASGLHLIERLG